MDMASYNSWSKKIRPSAKRFIGLSKEALAKKAHETFKSLQQPVETCAKTVRKCIILKFSQDTKVLYSWAKNEGQL